MVVLGVDPGLMNTGFGAVSCSERFFLIRCGEIKTSPQRHLSNRLVQIHRDMLTLLDDQKPDLVAVENVFSLVRYPRAGILLGGVIGVIYLAVADRRIPVAELTPREIKSSLTGYGAASKRQVRDFVAKLLEVNRLSSFHAADALAVAMAAFYRHSPEVRR
jgi:crossover junction endodeoxyribonuclease RuvC